MDRACSNCLHRGVVMVVDRMKSGQPVEKLACRLNPPQALLNGAGVAEAVWPVVQPGDWCGQWWGGESSTKAAKVKAVR